MTNHFKGQDFAFSQCPTSVLRPVTIGLWDSMLISPKLSASPGMWDALVRGMFNGFKVCLKPVRIIRKSNHTYCTFAYILHNNCACDQKASTYNYIENISYYFRTPTFETPVWLSCKSVEHSVRVKSAYKLCVPGCVYTYVIAIYAICAFNSFFSFLIHSNTTARIIIPTPHRTPSKKQ